MGVVVLNKRSTGSFAGFWRSKVNQARPILAKCVGGLHVAEYRLSSFLRAGGDWSPTEPRSTDAPKALQVASRGPLVLNRVMRALDWVADKSLTR